MSKVIEHLEVLNRTEPFHLLRQVLGKSTFRIDRGFCEELGTLLHVPIPGNAFIGMDYLLDWISLAVRFTDKSLPKGPVLNIGNDLFEANPLDADLLVAFDIRTTTHVVMIEAKGDTGWGNEQLQKKADRLRKIFSGTNRNRVTPHFVLMSPRRPCRINVKNWPDWMYDGHRNAPHWLELPLRPTLCKVTRHTEDSGKVWIEPVEKSQPEVRGKDWAAFFDADTRGSLPDRDQPQLEAREELR